MDRLLVHFDPPNLVLTGELDAINIANLQEAITALIEQGQQEVRLDLSRVTWCDRASLYIMLDFKQALRETDRSLILVAASPLVRRVMEDADLESRLPITPDARDT